MIRHMSRHITCSLTYTTNFDHIATAATAGKVNRDAVAVARFVSPAVVVDAAAIAAQACVKPLPVEISETLLQQT